MHIRSLHLCNLSTINIHFLLYMSINNIVLRDFTFLFVFITLG